MPQAVYRCMEHDKFFYTGSEKNFHVNGNKNAAGISTCRIVTLEGSNSPTYNTTIRATEGSTPETIATNNAAIKQAEEREEYYTSRADAQNHQEQRDLVLDVGPEHFSPADRNKDGKISAQEQADWDKMVDALDKPNSGGGGGGSGSGSMSFTTQAAPTVNYGTASHSDLSASKSQEVINYFKKYDKNKDGLLSKDEMPTAHYNAVKSYMGSDGKMSVAENIEYQRGLQGSIDAKLAKSTLSPKVKSLIREWYLAVDKNNDGSIQNGELGSKAKTVLAGSIGSDGKLSVDETIAFHEKKAKALDAKLKNSGLSQAKNDEIKEYFMLFDNDNSGFVTKSEVPNNGSWGTKIGSDIIADGKYTVDEAIDWHRQKANLPPLSATSSPAPPPPITPVASGTASTPSDEGSGAGDPAGDPNAIKYVNGLLSDDQRNAGYKVVGFNLNASHEDGDEYSAVIKTPVGGELRVDRQLIGTDDGNSKMVFSIGDRYFNTLEDAIDSHAAGHVDYDDSVVNPGDVVLPAGAENNGSDNGGEGGSTSGQGEGESQQNNESAGPSEEELRREEEARNSALAQRRSADEERIKKAMDQRAPWGGASAGSGAEALAAPVITPASNAQGFSGIPGSR